MNIVWFPGLYTVRGTGEVTTYLKFSVSNTIYSMFEFFEV